MAETLDVLKKLGKSVARGVPQLATGLVDLAALPLTMTGVRKPEQIFGSTAYLTDKGLLPQPQTGLLNEGAELASSMLNPAAAAKGATVGLLGTFIGKGSKLWNAESNSIAKALEKEGLAPETIWSQTGNVKAPDGKWRQEISDAEAVTTFPKRNVMGTVMPMEKRLSNENLYQAYPELRKMDLELTPKNSPSAGSFNSNWVELNASEAGLPNTKSILLHELQHAIQQKENFARGGTPESASFSDVLPKLEDVRSKIKELDIDPYRIQNNLSSGYNVPKDTLDKYNKWQSLKEQEDKLIANRMKPYDAYKRLFGEAEARLTENRIPLTQEQRLQYYPYAQGQYGLDVPYGELIVQGLLK
jgi:hypothetical protein